MALLAVAGVTAAAGAVMVLAANGATASPAPKPSGSDSGGNAQNVTFCHRTNSNTNPYVIITTDPNSIIKEGHGSHTGPIWNPGLKATHTKWGDIIPPFTYTDKKGDHSFPGLNWTAEGMAILDNGCVVPQSQSSGSSSSSSSSSGSSGASGASSSANSSNGNQGNSSAVSSPAPIPGGVSAGLHTPLSNAGLEAWGIVLLVVGGLGGLSVGMWPTRRRVH